MPKSKINLKKITGQSIGSQHTFLVDYYQDNESKTTTIKALDVIDISLGSSPVFTEHILPKVTVFLSHRLNHEGEEYGLCISELNPRIISSVVNDQELDYYVPWTHQFTLCDIRKSKIVESFICFSETSLNDDFQHRFYTPNLEEDNLEKPSLFNSIYNLDIPAFMCDPSFYADYSRASFGINIRTIFDDCITSYHLNSQLSAELTNNSDNFKKVYSTHLLKNVFSISDIIPDQTNIKENITFLDSVKNVIKSKAVS
jgi:hypothetical protein